LPRSLQLSQRVGYRTSQDVGSGASYGIGPKISAISLDYTYVPYGDLGNPQRISLGTEFRENKEACG